MRGRTQVGIVIFPEVEVLDFCGPFEVFSVTRLNEERRAEEVSPFQISLIAESADPVTTVGGMRVLPDATVDGAANPEIVIVPGGRGARALMNAPKLLSWLREQSAHAQAVASVCTGALVLGAAGLLDGRRATTHWAALEELRVACPRTQVISDQRVVEEGKIVTSAGISAGIDMALRLVARCCGEKVARATARRMEYPYPVSNTRGAQVGEPVEAQRP